MSKVIKPIVLNPNESLEIKLPKHGKLITKKSGKDLLIFEEGSDTPLAIYENYEAVASTIDLSSLPHFAEATTTTAAAAVASDTTATAAVAVASDTTATAVAGASVSSGVSTWAYVAGGLALAGGGAALAGGGSSSSSSSSSSSAPAVTSADTTAPVITSSTTASAITENTGSGQIVYTAHATDANAILYSLKNTGDAALMSINSTTGAVTLTASPDFETKSSYSFTVIATDTLGNASEKAVVLNINDINESPIATVDTATVDEDTVNNIITILANDTDVDGDTLTVTSASAINGAVSINQNGTLNYTPNARDCERSALFFSLILEYT